MLSIVHRLIFSSSDIGRSYGSLSGLNQIICFFIVFKVKPVAVVSHKNC